MCVEADRVPAPGATRSLARPWHAGPRPLGLGPSHPPGEPRKSRSRPGLECLERRAVPSTLTVTNLSDSGAGSLRGQIAAAASGDTIVFDGSLRGTISLTSGELAISRNLTIQGPGAGN